MEKETSICQSCSMPMTKDEDFGTDEDGSKNWRYCSIVFRTEILLIQ
ncbi:MAG: zinc ribbon domain-containing protein [Parcubacteria group bacterium]